MTQGQRPRWRPIAIVTLAVVGGVAALVGLAAVGAVLLTTLGGEKTARCFFYSGFASGDGYGLSWSRSGTEIAFARADGSPPDIYTVKVGPWPTEPQLPTPLSLTADGRRARVDNDNCASAFPSWSPDGRRFAYAGNHEAHGRYDVWVMNRDGSGARRVARGRGASTGPAWNGPRPANTAGPKPEWSADGRWLTFDTKDAAGVPAVWRVRSNGQGLQRVTPARLPGIRPSWSPDGRRIAFAADLDGDLGGLWVIGRDGSGPRQLTHGNDSNPAWSPDGRSIVFDRTEGDQATVWLLPAGGGPERRLTADDGYLPRWSPDGKWIAFVSERDGDARLYVMDARGIIERPIFPEDA